MSGEFTEIYRDTSAVAMLGSVSVGNLATLDLIPSPLAVELPPRVDDFLEGIDLPDDPSLEEMEPAVERHWTRFERLEAVEMVLGRRVDARALVEDETLAQIVGISEPSKAFAALMLLRGIEKQEQAAAQ